ncbi:MAG: FkbM family methyltransferase [Actinomycetota bacterium]
MRTRGVRFASTSVAAALRALAALGGDIGASAARRLTGAVPRAWDGDGPRRARRNGFTFQLDLSDYMQRYVFYAGCYDRSLRDFLVAEARPGDVCVDVGANIGVYALPLARRLKRLGGGQVYAFEPGIAAASALRRSIDSAALETIALVPLALGSRRSRMALRQSLWMAESDICAATLFGDGPEICVADVVAYDQWKSENGVEALDLIKIDVEGGEIEVLRGMGASIQECQPRAIVLEVDTGHLERAGTTVAELHALIDELGYEAEGPNLNDVACGRYGRLGPNVILRPREGTCRSRYRLRHGRCFQALRSQYRRLMDTPRSPGGHPRHSDAMNLAQASS